MPDIGFGGSSSGGSNSSGVCYSDGIGLPSGRAMSNGSTAVLIRALFLYIGGTSGMRVGSIQLGSSITGDFGVGAHASDSGTGWVGSSDWLVNGGSARIQWNGPASGPVYLGRGGGGTVNGPAGFSRAGTLGGAYRYAQAPSAIGTPSLTAGPGQLVVDFAGPADDGGAGLIDFVVQYGTDPSFASTKTTTTGTGHNVYSVTPGRVYYARIFSRNAVTNAAGAWSAPSGTGSARVGIGGKRWDGSAEQPFTTAMRWDGAAEVPITTAVRWDGAQEVAIT